MRKDLFKANAVNEEDSEREFEGSGEKKITLCIYTIRYSLTINTMPQRGGSALCFAFL